MIKCRRQASSTAPESRHRRRQEADRGLELEAAQVMLISQKHRYDLAVQDTVED